MKSVLNIVAAVLIAAGLVVAVASLLTPGQVILGIDFKLAATLVVGGLILHALASALLLLERMGRDLRQMRKAGNEEPPWLRKSTTQFAAAMAPALQAATTAVEAEERSPEDIGHDPAEPPPAAETFEPAFDPALEPELDFTSEADLDPQPRSIEAQEPDAVLLADEAEVAGELEVVEDVVEVEIEPSFEPEPAAVEGQPGPPGETGPAEPWSDDQGELPSELKPSRDAVETVESTEIAVEPALAPPSNSEAAEGPPALYVVEERVFQGKQARVLSDGTIEAETAQGWMRFEDFDHLEEYLDATAELGR